MKIKRSECDLPSEWQSLSKPDAHIYLLNGAVYCNNTHTHTHTDYMYTKSGALNPAFVVLFALFYATTKSIATPILYLLTLPFCDHCQTRFCVVYRCLL